MAIGRNDPCPCGSGRKYKHCCANKSSRGASRGLLALIALIAVIAAVGAIASFVGRNKTRATTPAGAVNTQAGRPQPGPAPPGKVWSPEHGHWHDANPAQGGQQPGATNVQIPPPAQNAKAPVPQPGPAPPGKVWSPEHGHWHDAPQ